MPSTYTTSQGETWDSIAKRVLGSEVRLHLLLDANPEHRGVLIFSAGTVLRIPDVPSMAIRTVTPAWKQYEV